MSVAAATSAPFAIPTASLPTKRPPCLDPVLQTAHHLLSRRLSQRRKRKSRGTSRGSTHTASPPATSLFSSWACTMLVSAHSSHTRLIKKTHHLQIEPHYGISYTTVSTLFVVPILGYLVAALSNSAVHHAVGRRGIAILGPLCRLAAFVPMALAPAYFPLLPAVLVLTGLGNGFNDSAWNAWVGNMHSANELLGILHGTYGVGGAIAPIVASAMITKLGLQWYTYYWVMVAMTLLELVVAGTAFWSSTAASYREGLESSTDSNGDGSPRKPATTRQILSTPVPWLLALFLFAYVGSEVSLGGWIPTFMIEVRHADPFLAGLTATLFWAGLTLGRVILGFVTGRVGEKLAITIYIALALALQLVYWLVPDLVVSMVSVVLVGFFLGPLFPATIVLLTKLLPKDQHVAAIGLTAALGCSGAALFPFMVGAIAESHGVKVLQPFVVGILVADLLIWLLLPGGFRRGGLEKAREQGYTLLGW